MRRKKLILIVVSLLLITFQSSITVNAYQRYEHDRILESVFFKCFKVIKEGDDTSKYLDAIESASYLCIDQFNGNGEKDLEKLKQFGVSELPSKISEIDFTANATHRAYTHRGWALSPQLNRLSKEKWELRKSILTGTLDKIFDFNDETQRDSFAALIYYIHLLGDRDAADKYDVNANVMEAGGRADKLDIINEMLKYIKILFRKQSSTHKYIDLTTILEKYNVEFSKLVRSTGGIDTTEKYTEYKDLVQKTINILTMYLPEMLKELDFFYDVFYKQSS